MSVLLAHVQAVVGIAPNYSVLRKVHLCLSGCLRSFGIRDVYSFSGGDVSSVSITW